MQKQSIVNKNICSRDRPEWGYNTNLGCSCKSQCRGMNNKCSNECVDVNCCCSSNCYFYGRLDRGERRIKLEVIKVVWIWFDNEVEQLYTQSIEKVNVTLAQQLARNETSKRLDDDATKQLN